MLLPPDDRFFAVSPNKALTKSGLSLPLWPHLEVFFLPPSLHFSHADFLFFFEHARLIPFFEPLHSVFTCWDIFLPDVYVTNSLLIGFHLIDHLF